jgi:hypothetical protein
MSYVMFDKENDIRENFQVTNSARKFGDSVIKSAQLQCTTPQHKMKLKDTKGITNTEKRRALGDLINSSRVSQALLGTPKATLSSKINGTPVIKSNCMKKLTNDFERQSIGSVSVKQSEPLPESHSYPAAEKCIQQVDTFNDLFEDTGKISDLFIKRPVTYVPRLPSGKLSEEKKLRVFEDSDVNRSVKEMNKLIRNEVKKENKACLENYQEMPEFLDLPPILEDFDTSLDGEVGEL